MAYQVLFTARAIESLNSITDRRIRNQVLQRVARLSEEPDKQGRPLSGDLFGYRSARAVGQRYRVIFRIEHDQVRVVIIVVGLRREGSRRDIYALARRLAILGLTEPPREEEER